MAQVTRLQSPASPNLPIAPMQYSSQHYDVLNNVLRLYFNRIDQSLAALFNNTGGRFLNMPYITAYDTTDQYAVGNDTPTKIAWSNGTVNGFRLQSGAAYADQKGLYKIDYSLQLANNANAVHEVTVWLRINGVDLPASASFFTVPARKNALTPSYIVAYSHVTYEMDANDYVELWWATDQAATSGGILGIYIHYEAANTVPPDPFAHPSVPSALGTITFVSAPQA